MFGELLRRMTAPEPESLSGGDSRLALAALLVRIARADGSYDDSEKSRINKVLARRFDLSPFEVAENSQECRDTPSRKPRTRCASPAPSRLPCHTRIANRSWNPSGKIALADGSRDHEEDALMRLGAPMLGINDRDSAIARQRAAKKG